MIVDANVLLFAQDASSPHHEPCRLFLTEALNGTVRVGLPWPSLIAFLRIRTNPRAYARPLSPEEAWEHVRDWLRAPAAWVPVPTERHADVVGDLIRRYRFRAGLLSDVHLAALAIEHGISVCSADTDFTRFTELRWINPLSSAPR
jgi:toxin-antitoxin system PIN domain toxin